MHWSFPVASGTPVEVRLYFANRYTGTSGVGQRVFDVSVNSTTVLDHYDIVADVGDQTGTMKAFDVTSTGNITIDFKHEVENPLINGIEIVKEGAPPSVSVDDLDYRAMSVASIGPLTKIDGGGVNWGSVRGAFMVGNRCTTGLAQARSTRLRLTALPSARRPRLTRTTTRSGRTSRQAPARLTAASSRPTTASCLR
jgi:hypothetical protein